MSCFKYEGFVMWALPKMIVLILVFCCIWVQNMISDTTQRRQDGEFTVLSRSQKAVMPARTRWCTVEGLAATD